MALRSRISPRFFVNELASAMSEDWDTSRKFVRYQLAKESFNWRHPLGAKHGRGDAIQLGEPPYYRYVQPPLPFLWTMGR